MTDHGFVATCRPMCILSVFLCESSVHASVSLLLLSTGILSDNSELYDYSSQVFRFDYFN